jgi:hypothetical protein
MKMIVMFFKKSVLMAVVAALGMASLPLATVAAADEYDPPIPPVGQGQISNEKLEQVWARELHLYERIGNGLERVDRFTEKLQQLIDRAKENGKDVSAVQAALDAFEAAIKNVHPIYESGKGIVNSHQGFDSNGKVTDPEKAKETVLAMREKLKEIKAAMNGTGRALRAAIKAYREANPPPQPTSTPESG